MTDNDLQNALTPADAEKRESAQQAGSETASPPLPAPCEAAPKEGRSKGGQPQNVNAVRTGRRARRDTLVRADLGPKYITAKRNAWHDQATAAVKAANGGKPLSFQQADLLLDGARFEAITLLAENRRRMKGLTFDQLARLDATISNALTAKSRILVRLGLAKHDPAAAIDDDFAALDALHAAPPAFQPHASTREAPDLTPESSEAPERSSGPEKSAGDELTDSSIREAIATEGAAL